MQSRWRYKSRPKH